MAQGAVRDLEKRHDKIFAVVLALAIFCFVLATTFGVFLFVEHKARVGPTWGVSVIGACQVPGIPGNSTYGHGVWQSWPPGTRCERGQDLDIAPTAPRVWSRPGGWRGAAVIVLMLSGVALAVAFWRVRDRDVWSATRGLG